MGIEGGVMENDNLKIGAAIGDKLSELVGVKKKDEKGVSEEIPPSVLADEDIKNKTAEVAKNMNMTESFELPQGTQAGTDLGNVLYQSAVSGWNMGFAKIGTMMNRYIESQKEAATNMENYDDFKPLSFTQSDEEKEKQKEVFKRADALTEEEYGTFINNARMAQTKRDEVLESIPSAPLRVAYNVAGGLVENTTDLVELSKMMGVNVLSGGIGGGLGLAVDTGLGAIDNYFTANMESQILYKRDATEKEKLMRAAIGAGAQLGLTAVTKGIRKAIEFNNNRIKAQAEFDAEVKTAAAQEFSQPKAAMYDEVKTGDVGEVTGPYRIDDSVEIDPIKEMRTQSDVGYGVIGQTENLNRSSKLVNGGEIDTKVDGTVDPITNTINIKTDYNFKNVDISVPTKIEVPKNATSLEAQNLTMARSTVSYPDKDGNIINLRGYDKREAAYFGTYTQPKLQKLIDAGVIKAEVAARRNEIAYSMEYEKFLGKGEASKIKKLSKYDPNLVGTINEDIRNIITKPLDNEYFISENDIIYKIGQVMGENRSRGDLVFGSQEGSFSRAFVTGNTDGIRAENFGDFNGSMQRTHEILFANRTKSDVIGSLLVDNKYSAAVEISPEGGVRLKSNTGTVLDRGNEGLVDLYINRNNAQGPNIHNDYSRLGMTEPGDVIEVINAFASPEELNSKAIMSTIEKNIPEQNRANTISLLEEVGIFKKDMDGEFITSKSDLINGFVELERRLVESQDKGPIEDALKILYSKEKSPFEVRDVNGNVVDRMSMKDLIINNYKDDSISLREVQKIDRPLYESVQHSIQGKLRYINEKLKDGHVRDMLDEVKVTQKITNAMNRIEGVLKDITAQNVDDKLNGVQFKNDIQALRDLNKVYNFVDDEALKLLDIAAYGDKEKFVAKKVADGKVALEDSKVKFDTHIDDVIAKNKEGLISEKQKLSETHAKQIYDIDAELDARLSELAKENEAYKEYKKKAAEAKKLNANYEKYEAALEKYENEKAMFEHVNKQDLERYEANVKSYNEEKAKYEAAEVERFNTEKAEADANYEAELGKRKQLIQSEFDRRMKEYADNLEKAKQMQGEADVEAKYKEMILERGKQIQSEYKEQMKLYNEDMKKYQELQIRNEKIAEENMILEAQYKRALKEWEDKVKSFEDYTDVQAEINKYPDLYEELPPEVKKHIKKPTKTAQTKLKKEAKAEYDKKVSEIKARNEEALREYEVAKEAGDGAPIYTETQKQSINKIQETVNQYPDLYNDLPNNVKSALKKPKQKAKVKLPEAEKVLTNNIFKTEGYKGKITLDDVTIDIDIPKGYYDKVADISKIVERQIPEHIRQQMTPSMVQKISNKLAKQDRIGLSNLPNMKDKDTIKYLNDRFGKDVIDNLRAGKTSQGDLSGQVKAFEDISGDISKIEKAKPKKAKLQEPKLEEIPEFTYDGGELSEFDKLMKMAELSKKFERVDAAKKTAALKPVEPTYKKLADIKKPIEPTREAIGEKIPMPEKPKPVEPTKIDLKEPTLKEVEDLFAEPTRKEVVPARKFEGVEPVKPTEKVFDKKPPIKPEQAPEIPFVNKPETLKEGKARIMREAKEKKAKLESDYKAQISEMGAKAKSLEVMYKEVKNNVNSFVKDMKKLKPKNAIEWINSNDSLNRVAALESFAKTLPDSDLKIEVNKLIDGIYEMADLQNTKLIEKDLAKEYITESIGKLKEQAAKVNKESINVVRDNINKMKDYYKNLLKTMREKKRSNPFTLYDDVDINKIKSEIAELNAKVSNIFGSDAAILPMRTMELHKDLLKNTKESVENGLINNIKKTASPKMLTADNVEMARLGAVINKKRLLADRGWYDMKNPGKIEGAILKGVSMESKYWNIDKIVKDIKDISEVEPGTAKKVINPTYYERFEKLYNEAADLFGSVKEGDDFRDVNIDEFAVLYFKFLSDLNQTKGVVGKYSVDKKLRLGDLKGYFKDKYSMVKFMTIENPDIQRVGYIKSNNDMLNYFQGDFSKRIAEYSYLGTDLNNFTNLIKLQNKNAKTSLQKSLKLAGSEQVKDIHGATLDMIAEKLEIYNNKNPYSSNFESAEPTWSRVFSVFRNTLMANILNMVGTREFFTNPLSISRRFKEMWGDDMFNTGSIGQGFKGFAHTSGMLPKHFGNYIREVANFGMAVFQPLIQIGKFNEQVILPTMRNTTNHKYVNRALQYMYDAEMANRHTQMANFTANNGKGLAGYGNRVSAAWKELCFSMQKGPDRQKFVLSGEYAYKGMEMIRDLGGLSSLTEKNQVLKNMLFDAGIRNEQDLIDLQSFLGKYTKDGAIDLNFFELNRMRESLGLEDMSQLETSYNIFTSMFKHMEDYRDSQKFDPIPNNFVSQVGSFLKGTVMGMAGHELRHTLYTMDDNGFFVNRWKHGYDKGGVAGGAQAIGKMGLDVGSYLTALGVSGTAGMIFQNLTTKPLETKRDIAERRGEWERFTNSFDVDQDGKGIGEYVFGTLSYAMYKGVGEYPTLVYKSGGNFFGDTVEKTYKILGNAVGDIQIENPKLLGSLQLVGLDPESIKYRANGGQFGDFRDTSAYQLSQLLFSRGFTGAVNAGVSLLETPAEKEKRTRDELARVQYRFKTDPQARRAATETYLQLGNMLFDSQNEYFKATSAVADVVSKQAKQEGLITEEEYNKIQDDRVELEGVKEDVEKLPDPVKKVAENLPEFMGKEKVSEKALVQKQVIADAGEGATKQDVVNNLTGGKYDMYKVFESGDPKNLPKPRKEMYDDMKSMFNITDDKELLRIICNADNPSAALEEVGKAFKPKTENIGEYEKETFFDEMLPFIYEVEGGYLNDSRTGEESMYGITRQTARAHGYYGAMKDIPKELASKIYKKSYYNPVAKLTDNKATIAMLTDTAINMGMGFAKKIYAEHGDNLPALMNARVAKYQSLARQDKFKPYLKVWMDRLNRLGNKIAKLGDGQLVGDVSEVNLPEAQMAMMPNAGPTGDFETPTQQVQDDTIESVREETPEPVLEEEPTYAADIPQVEEKEPIPETKEEVAEAPKEEEEKPVMVAKEEPQLDKIDTKAKEDTSKVSTSRKSKISLEEKLVSKLKSKGINADKIAITLKGYGLNNDEIDKILKTI